MKRKQNFFFKLDVFWGTFSNSLDGAIAHLCKHPSEVWSVYDRTMALTYWEVSDVNISINNTCWVSCKLIYGN